MTPIASPVASVEDVIARASARCLRTQGPIDPEMPFALLGLDSLATIEMAVVLEEELGREVPADLLVECANARALAIRLAELCATDGTTHAYDPFARMYADAVLPPAIYPAVDGTGARTVGLVDARTILLTGATGFLGTALVKDLLQTSHAEIVCLVRSDGSATGRLRDHLLGAGVDASVLDARVTALNGDLSSPYLGLSSEQFNTLAHGVDAICHAGAAVNWVFSYAALRAANVTGTLELLRLACVRGIPFHFISSISTCYSTTRGGESARTVDERHDALPELRGVHLGYAQTKIVAEALVREAGARGLPVRIYRPSLIAGHSETGAFNSDDLISALVRGCVHMGVAPDLDWTLDSQPVDVVSRAIIALSSEPGPVFHLTHERPRHWRECILWMRLYGYPIRLVSYHKWLRQLERETEATDAATHPLRPLRSFFLDRPDGARGLTRPELYEEARRTRVASDATRAAVASAGVVCPALDGALLDTYFSAFRASGHLPAPPGAQPATQPVRRSAISLDTCFFSDLLGVEVIGARVLGSGSDHSIVSELTAWRSQRPTGLFRVRLEVNEDGRQATRTVVVKAKAMDSDVIAVGDALAGLLDPAIGHAYSRWSDRIGCTACHARELAIYAQSDPRFVAHAPEVCGAIANDVAGDWLLVLEDLAGEDLMDSTSRPERWTTAHVAAAVDGLSALQAIWFQREVELRRQSWIGHVQSTASMIEMTDLWSALAAHAAPALSSWAGPDIVSIQRQLIANLGGWWNVLERGPLTLIHNDFNPRNLCMRRTPAGPRLCAYDWELATIGAPQRDLAELLCFLDVSDADAPIWIGRHRTALERATGTRIPDDEWDAGFRAALGDFLINRLATYALVNRVRRQSFLPRVVRTWRRLFAQFPIEEGA